MFKGKQGFTLIEVLVACVILSVVAVPFTRVFFQGNYLATAAGKKTTAVNLAQQKMEEIIEQGPGENISLTPFPGEYSDYSYQVEAVPEDNMQLVTVTVLFSAGGQEGEVVLSTLLSGGG